MKLVEKSADYTAWLEVRLIAEKAERCDTLAELDALAKDAEDVAQYIPEGDYGAPPELMRAEMLAAIDRRRALLEMVRIAQQLEHKKAVPQPLVALLCGVSVRQVKRWEDGKHNPPLVKTNTGRMVRYSEKLRNNWMRCLHWCDDYRLTHKKKARKARYFADLPTSATFNPDTLDAPAEIAAERGRLT